MVSGLLHRVVRAATTIDCTHPIHLTTSFVKNFESPNGVVARLAWAVAFGGYGGSQVATTWAMPQLLQHYCGEYVP